MEADATRRMHAVTAIALVLLGAVTVARAQVSADDSAEARRTALFEQGVAAASAGDWARARDRFRDALVIRSSPKVLFSEAQAEEHVGQLASAQQDYDRALEAARQLPGEEDVVRSADEARRRLAPRVPHLRLLVTPTVEGTTARLDDQPIAPDAPIAIDPGEHRLAVSAPGMKPFAAVVPIAEGVQLAVPVALEAAPGPPPAAAPSPVGPISDGERGAAPRSEPPRRGGTLRIIGLAAGGVGVAALGIGTYFGLDARSKRDASNAQPGGCVQNFCPPPAARLRNEALDAANASTAFFIAGGTLLAGGLALWLLAPSNAAIGVAPVALQSGGGILVTRPW